MCSSHVKIPPLPSKNPFEKKSQINSHIPYFAVTYELYVTTPSGLRGGYQCSGKIRCLHPQDRREVRGSIFLQNSSTLLLITQLYTSKTRVSFTSQSHIHNSSVKVTSTEQGHRHSASPLVNLY